MQRQRLDKWLWHARVVRARASAAALVEAGHVRVNGAREKSPGHAVKAGDVITVSLDRKPVHLDLNEADKPAASKFDRFGLVTPWIDGNGQVVYFDDVTYSVGQ